MSESIRLQAAEILTALSYNNNLSTLITEKHTPALKNLCYSSARYYFQLYEILNKLVTKPIKAKLLNNLLIIGLYELAYGKTPEYAVINEIVTTVKTTKYKWAFGLANAVLRNFKKNKTTLLQEHHLHPKWLYDKIKSNWPQHYQDIITANNQHPPLTLRINTKVMSLSCYEQILVKNNIEFTVNQNSIILNNPCSTKQIPEFDTGIASIQDLAPQYAAQLLDLQPKLRVLDACSAPGGKACHMLQLMPDLDLSLIDNSQQRLDKVNNNLQRINAKAKVICNDATKPKLWWDNKPYDRILLDAPCSATGIIRRQPDIKLTKTMQQITILVKQQQQLLNALWPLLKVGGILLYATCSILPEENSQQIADFLHKNNNAKLLPININNSIATSSGSQILPSMQHNMDGFFYAKLQKLS